MKRIAAFCAAWALLAFTGGPALGQTVSEVLAQSPAESWRPLDLENTIVMQLAGGAEVVIELAPAFAPQSAANILALAQARYYDGLAIVRVQDSYVTQWGDPEGDQPTARPRPATVGAIPAEFAVPRRAAVPFVRLRDGDVYAPEAGFVGSFPAARDRRQAWLAHCYGMVGVGRDNAPDSGVGTDLYAVIGHSPRHLDRNITLVGRVVQGMEALAALPRGRGALGFYETPAERTSIRWVRQASTLPNGGAAGRLEVMRTDSDTFRAYVEARRNRREEWFATPSGRIEVCNALPPVRARAS